MTASPLDAARKPEHADPCATPWYVTDPSTGMTQYVEADAERTARWVAWEQWYGPMPRTDQDERHYASLEVNHATE